MSSRSLVRAVVSLSGDSSMLHCQPPEISSHANEELWFKHVSRPNIGPPVVAGAGRFIHQMSSSGVMCISFAAAALDMLPPPPMQCFNHVNTQHAQFVRNRISAGDSPWHNAKPGLSDPISRVVWHPERDF